MFAKRLLRASTLVLSAVLVGIVGFSFFASSEKVSAHSVNGKLAYGENTITHEMEDFDLAERNGTYYFNGYYGNRVTSAKLGIPLEYQLAETGETVEIVGIYVQACYEYAITELSIPEGVTVIENEAFAKCTGLVKVTFPSSLESLGNNAFSRCELLKTVDLSKTSVATEGTDSHNMNGVEGNVNGQNCFADCISLESIKFPQNSKFKIVPAGFCKGCKRLTSLNIPDTVTEIDVSAFEGCILLESVKPSSKTMIIDASAFNGCTAITSFKIPNTVNVIGKSAFENCSKLETVIMNEGLSLEYVWDYAFTRTKLQSITIPSTCDKLFMLRKGAFQDCSELASVIVNSDALYTFDNSCFMNCVSLQKITIGENILTGIGENCFRNCKLLGDIASKKHNIIKNVVNIGPGAFYGCETFTEFCIPDVPTIGDNTFYGCKNIKNLYFSSSNKNALDKIGDYAFTGCSKLVISGGKLPSTITVIGDYAFDSCKAATSIIVPASLEKIGMGAFRNCGALASFTIPDGITTLYDYTFQGCASLKSIKLPSGILLIPRYCFAECSSLESVTMGNQVTTIGEFAFYKCSSLCHKTGVLSLSQDLELIGESAFQDCAEIKSVSIPSGVTFIPNRCFANCVLLKTLNLNKVTSVGVSSFERCESLAELNFPSGFKTFSNNSFRQCSSLEVVLIPDTVNEIPDNCFSGCTSLEYVRIPDSVTILGRACFGSCNLVAVEFPDSLLNVSDYAFENNAVLNRVVCKNNQVTILKYLGNYADVEVPSTIYQMPVVAIADEAYRGIGIRSCHVPSSVKSIGYGAFQDCKQLLTVRIPSSTTIAGDAFQDVQTTYRIVDVDEESVKITNFYGTAKEVNIPDRLENKLVVAIGDDAFKGNIYITDVIVPSSVKTIGARAFKDCSNAFVRYPAAASVGKDAFAGCRGSEPYGNAPTVTPKPTPGPGNPTPSPKDPSIGDFIERLYTIALNRASDAEGKKYWVKEVTSGNKTGADCARGFLVDTPEFQNRNLPVEDFVETLYLTFFDRESEPNGKAYWVGVLKNGTMSRLEVILGFIDSKEWCNVCADYGVKSGAPTKKAERASKNATRFAERLYTCCLGREAEANGLKYWSLALTNLEQTGCSAAGEFFNSQEFKNFNLNVQEYVKRLYRTFMDREPSAEEVNYWAGAIANGTQTRQSVLSFFGTSPEFTNICKSYGIDRGTL